MIVNTNKERGNAGIALAIAYYGANGYTVSIPLNDTQDYDLIIDDGSLKKVQAKFSKQESKYGVPMIPLRSLGGTNGSVYKRLIDTDIDLVFCATPDGKMWSVPKTEVTQTNVLSLGARYEQYRVTL